MLDEGSGHTDYDHVVYLSADLHYIRTTRWIARCFLARHENKSRGTFELYLIRCRSVGHPTSLHQVLPLSLALTLKPLKTQDRRHRRHDRAHHQHLIYIVGAHFFMHLCCLTHIWFRSRVTIQYHHGLMRYISMADPHLLFHTIWFLLRVQDMIYVMPLDIVRHHTIRKSTPSYKSLKLHEELHDVFSWDTCLRVMPS